MATRKSIAAAQAEADALGATLNGGSVTILTGVSVAGGQPSDVEDGTTAGMVLATFTLADPAFANAKDGAPGAVLSANGIAGVSAETSGVPRYFRAFTSASAHIIDGAVGSASSGAEMLLTSVDLDQDQLLTINTWTITVPQSAG